MKLSTHDLKQLDNDKIAALTHEGLKFLSATLLADLKEAVDRLNQNSQNSSRPSGSEAPWECGAQTVGEDDDDDEDTDPSSTTKDEDKRDSQLETESEGKSSNATTLQENKVCSSLKGTVKLNPGRQPGSQGYGRTQDLKITGIEEHFVSSCIACGAAIAYGGQTAWNGWYSIDIAERNLAQPGMFMTNTKHVIYEANCPACYHKNRVCPYRACSDGFWEKTNISEWRLIGPRLASMLSLLSIRYRLSRTRIREFLMVFFGLELATGTINSAIREAARGAAPLEEELIHDIGRAVLAYADETSWLEAGKLCWLWVLKTADVVLFFIGKRDRQTFYEQLSRSGFAGTLMTDGYVAYRNHINRIRCWAHLVRKIRGLAESCNKTVAKVGKQMLTLFTKLQEAIYEARAQGVSSIAESQAETIDCFTKLCIEHQDPSHDKLKAFSREFLNDREIILRQTQDVLLPLTNNEAERSLRHLVIARRISYGTRTAEGTKAFTILASIIETCRLRCASSWDFLTEVIAATRKGLAPPSLPPPFVLAAAAG